MSTISNRYITAPQYAGGDGLGFCDGRHWEVENSIIDLSGHPLSRIDEAVGVTWGSSATFRNCVIRGAGKLVLLGCGDADMIYRESGRLVRFENCVLERFGRRGPEVQNLMVCEMRRCLVRGWGCRDRFSVRSFAAWAHKGGTLHCRDVVFDQPDRRFSLRGGFLDILDRLGHLGQAVRERSPYALLDRASWLPGRRRGLCASDGGNVFADHCFAGKPWIILEHHSNPMTSEEAARLTEELETMAYNLRVVLGVREWREWNR